MGFFLKDKEKKHLWSSSCLYCNQYETPGPLTGVGFGTENGDKC